jgi:DNA-binding response OmpR family regulator
MFTILIVDDKASVRRLLQEYLSQQGYHTLTATNGAEALYTARHERPDLVLLDIMMPEMDGFEFIRSYRREGDAPIILLTARMEEPDKVIGLELGADDYVTKPFNMRELLARIHAVLRRSSQAKPQTQILRAGHITLDPVSRQAEINGQPVHLTPSEFDLLAIFMASPGKAFNRLELLEALQGIAFEGIARTIDVHIRNLRTKIEPNPAKPTYIETVFGTGYRFRRPG